MTTRQRGWRFPAALVVLSVIPVLAGAARRPIGGPTCVRPAAWIVVGERP
jgi:hypothetical protein